MYKHSHDYPHARLGCIGEEEKDKKKSFVFKPPRRKQRSTRESISLMSVCVCPWITACWCLNTAGKDEWDAERKEGEVSRDRGKAVTTTVEGGGQGEKDSPYLQTPHPLLRGSDTAAASPAFHGSVSVIWSWIYPPSNKYQQSLWTYQSSSRDFNLAEAVCPFPLSGLICISDDEHNSSAYWAVAYNPVVIMSNRRGQVAPIHGGQHLTMFIASLYPHQGSVFWGLAKAYGWQTLRESTGEWDTDSWLMFSACMCVCLCRN